VYIVGTGSPKIQTATRTNQNTSLMSVLGPLVASVRPKQWMKNLLVGAGALFSGNARDERHLVLAFLGVIAFTLASGAIYLFNDVLDIDSDRLHPTRRHRPIASGQVSAPLAIGTAAVLMLSSMALSYAIARLFLAIVLIYFAVNGAYSLGAKRIVIVDAILVGSGFVLRVVAGAVAIEVAASSWIIVCTLQLALLVVFGKRRVDLVQAEAAGIRNTLPEEWYTVPFLDIVMATAAGAAVVTYSLYTFDPQTVERVGNRRLVATLPMVVYGCLRYLYLIVSNRGSSDPTSVLMSDWGLRICAVVWLVVASAAVYL
jgi:4-hydroxybenzoate polyprenyltransferase